MKILTAILLSVALSQNCLAQDDCSKNLEIKKDKFTGEKTITTPLMNTLGMIKIVKDSAKYFLALTSRGETLNYSTKGAYVLFDDSSKFIKEDAVLKVRANPYGSGYLYDAFIPITKTEVDLFSTKIITDIKLYIYDHSYKKSVADEFKCNVIALIKSE